MLAEHDFASCVDQIHGSVGISLLVIVARHLSHGPPIDRHLTGFFAYACSAFLVSRVAQ